MGIDATKKLPEEMRFENAMPNFENKNGIAKEKIFAKFPAIKDINDSLLKENISLVFIAIEKNKKGQVAELSKALFELADFKLVKIIIFLEHTIDISDIADAVWRFSNNVDPKRDAFVISVDSQQEPSHIAFDGTKKTKEFDGFTRDWPNILANTQEVIDQVDAMWDRLGLGPMPVSPSRKYLGQLYGTGAVVKE
jgi:4-hydroxy-3-polyprenylbenzoate decarboxylase